MAAKIRLLLAGLALIACGEREPAATRLAFDFIERFPEAEVMQPTVQVDFSDPAALPRMLAGWSTEIAGKDAARIARVWSEGAAELEFFVDRVSDLTVTLRCAPTDEREIHLSLRVNGAPWRDLPLEGGLTSYSLALPATLLRRGENRLQIGHSAAGDDGGIRRASKTGRVRWELVRFQPDPGQAAPRPFVRSDRKLLFIPYGTRIDYYLELPQDGALRIGKIGSPDGDGRLLILWKATDGEENALAETGSGALDLQLGSASGESGRLSFFATGRQPKTADSAGILVSAPAIYAAPAPVETAAPLPVERAARGPRLPNVVIYLIDTLRADHLGCYGYDKDTSPNIDRFADSAVLFEDAQAQSSWTRSAVASVLTGLLPQVHGANDDRDALAEGIVTLAEVLENGGYWTVAVTGNANAGKGYGFAQGFDVFERVRKPKGRWSVPRSSDLNALAFRYLAKAKPEKPMFLFIHTVDPHAPYDPPEPFRTKFAGFVEDTELGSVKSLDLLGRRADPPESELVTSLLALYDAEVAANDHSFGELVAELQQHDAYEDSLIILLSDHGEEFYDHGGWEHGKSLHSELLETPLIIKMPGMSAGRRVAQMAQHIDILPTIADYLGLDPPQGIQGRSLLPILEGVAPAGGSESAMAHLDLRGRLATSLIEGPWKIIQDLRTEQESFPELYDRDRDRHERRNLAAEQADRARLLVSLRGRREREAGGEAFEAPKVDITDKLVAKEELKALGYVQ